MPNRFAATLLVAATGCASSGSAVPQQQHQTGTRYRVGDYVVYGYSGAFTPAPVTLREVVLEQVGNRLVIEVTATRGGDERQWLQVVTDTPENQRNNVVDELYLIADGKKVRLANKGNQDLYRLCEWAVLQPDGRASEVTSHSGQFDVSGTTFVCEVSTGKNAWHGKRVRFETYECAEFLWTHGPGRFWVDGADEDIMRVDVLDAGHAPRERHSRRAGSGS